MPIRAYVLRHVSEDSLRRIEELKMMYCQKPKKYLVQSYNEGYEKGFRGVYSQALYFVALHLAFEDRFGLSPFTAVGNFIAFKQPIVLLYDATWQFVQLDTSAN